MPKYPGWIFSCDNCGNEDAKEEDILPPDWVEWDNDVVLCPLCTDIAEGSGE